MIDHAVPAQDRRNMRGRHLLPRQDLRHQPRIHRISLGPTQGRPVSCLDVQGSEDEHLIALSGEGFIATEPVGTCRLTAYRHRCRRRLSSSVSKRG